MYNTFCYGTIPYNMLIAVVTNIPSTAAIIIEDTPGTLYL